MIIYILEVSGLRKVYTSRLGGSRVEALRNVSFTVEQGEYVAIMGEDVYKRQVSSGKSWQGWLDSNQRMRESKSLALPLGDTPVWKGMRDRDTPDPSFLFVGWVKGLEPSTPGTTIRCSNQMCIRDSSSTSAVFSFSVLVQMHGWQEKKGAS